ncbi:hypothetical protein [Streptomyces sirii]|uniref:hypothetical protein n=1 Tax=Streptomyces sirii TaxID=3127701 RepID=UPI003D36C467
MGLEGAEAQLAVHRAVAVPVDERWLIYQEGKAVHPLLLAESPPGAVEAPRPVGLTEEVVVR